MEANRGINLYNTETEAITDLKRRGFTANLEYLDNTFRAVDNGKAFKAEELTIVERHRFEGASDPDDESVVYAIESRDGIRGTLVDAFGPYPWTEIDVPPDRGPRFGVTCTTSGGGAT